MPTTIVKGGLTPGVALSVTVGALYEAEVQYSNPDGTAMNLTGKTVEARIVSDEVDIPVTVTVVNLATGRVDLSIPSASTEDLLRGEHYEMEVDLIRADGEIEERGRAAVRGD